MYVRDKDDMTIGLSLDDITPGEKNIDLGVSGDDDDEWDDEDLAVVERVVDVRPVVRAENKLLSIILRSLILFRIMFFGNLVIRDCIYKKIANITLYPAYKDLELVLGPDPTKV